MIITFLTVIYFLSLILCYFLFMETGKRKLFYSANGVIAFIVISIIPLANCILIFVTAHKIIVNIFESKKIDVNKFAEKGFKKEKIKKRKDHL